MANPMQDLMPGSEFMGENVRKLLKRCGEGVRLNPLAKICKPEVVEIGDHSRVCDFAFIWGGKGVKIGKYVDVQVQTVVWGGGELEMGDYVSFGLGSILLTAVYDHKDGLRMVDGLPADQAHAIYGKLTIGNDVYIGAHSTVLPNITVGDGAIIGAHSMVNKDVEPWSIVVGSPAKKIGMRPKVKFK
jgi:galactoside O-acetyltransferase